MFCYLCLKVVAVAIGVLIASGKEKTNDALPALEAGQKQPREWIFDERFHPLKNTLKKGYPSDEDIFKYMRIIYKKTRMQPECIVMTVSYIEKLLTNPLILMNCYTWRRIILAGLIVADKVFEGLCMRYYFPSVLFNVFLKIMLFGMQTSCRCFLNPTFKI